jgi:hypothetical protein
MRIEELTGRKALGIDVPEDYVNWAVECLTAGSSSENVAILAGLDLDRPMDSEEVRKYFQRACGELGIEWPDKQVALKRYARRLCEELVAERADPTESLFQLAELFPASGCSEELYALWEGLDEDLAQLDDGRGAIFNSGFTRENADAYIRQVAAQFLRLLSIDLPKSFWGLAYCSACEAIEKPVAKKINSRPLARMLSAFRSHRRAEYQLVCARCGSPHILHMHDYRARQIFLDRREHGTNRPA